MNEIFEKFIEKNIKTILKNYKKYGLNNINIYYLYFGFEILPYCNDFFSYEGTVKDLTLDLFPFYNEEKEKYKLSKDLKNLKNKVVKIANSLSSPPTHIKVTYDIKKDSYEFEYIYDKLLDEEKDNFGTVFDEWQYQLGKPRPEEIDIPEGHHLEIRSIKKEIKDDQGRVIRIEAELVPVIIKDDEKRTKD
ncbi:MAG: hypothetical protein ACRCXZ_05040 [Patescibacteria group bacterium]